MHRPLRLPQGPPGLPRRVARPGLLHHLPRQPPPPGLELTDLQRGEDAAPQTRGPRGRRLPYFADAVLTTSTRADTRPRTRAWFSTGRHHHGACNAGRAPARRSTATPTGTEHERHQRDAVAREMTPTGTRRKLACNACHGGIYLATRYRHREPRSAPGAGGDHVHQLPTVPRSVLWARTLRRISPTSRCTPTGSRTWSRGTFTVGGTVAFSFGADTCSNVSCHGGYANVNWGAATSCANCHGTFGLMAQRGWRCRRRRRPSTRGRSPTGTPTSPPRCRQRPGHRRRGEADGEGRPPTWCHANTQPLHGGDAPGRADPDQLERHLPGPAGSPAPRPGAPRRATAATAPTRWGTLGNTLASIAGRGSVAAVATRAA